MLQLSDKAVATEANSGGVERNENQTLASDASTPADAEGNVTTLDAVSVTDALIAAAETTEDTPAQGYSLEPDSPALIAFDELRPRGPITHTSSTQKPKPKPRPKPRRDIQV